MLILKRKKQSSVTFRVTEPCEFTVTTEAATRLVIDAPACVVVVREEAVEKERKAA